MNAEQAKSELMQIYMSLSEEKKKALDVAFKAMEQADNIPVMYYPQVDGITPTVVAQADGEKTCGTCRNEDTYHCAECENKSDYEQSQADGEYILKKDVMGCIGQTSVHSELARKLRKLPSVAIPHDGEYISRQAIEEYVGEYSYKHGCNWIDNSVLYKFIKQLPSVAIPPEHDGCKDCRWQSQSETEMPCKQCMHNYTDEWANKPHWIMKHRTINEVKYHTGLDDMGEEHTIKELIRYEVDEPYCSECGMKAGDTSQNYCCFCGAKMD